MALWLCRVGRHGEHEQKFLEEGRVYLTWGGLKRDLSKVKDREAMYKLVCEIYAHTGASAAKLQNHTAQIWAFSKKMNPKDWAVLPSKLKPAIHIGEITGDYVYDGSAKDPYYHHRTVKWIARDIPRTNFDQDLLYALVPMTICEIKRNDAERRVHDMAAHGWKYPRVPVGPETGESPEDNEPLDLEEIAFDGIAKLISAKFKGHAMAHLVGAILKAQGYTTLISPEGPDKGVDLLAAPGPMGFGQPRICVQVKSGDAPIDRPTLDQLLGTMSNFQAQQGLLVSWGGFKSSVEKEEAVQFFRVRLWDQKDLIEQLLAHYDKLDADLRAELPLKRIWTIAAQEEEE